MAEVAGIPGSDGEHAAVDVPGTRPAGGPPSLDTAVTAPPPDHAPLPPSAARPGPAPAVERPCAGVDAQHAILLLESDEDENDAAPGPLPSPAKTERQDGGAAAVGAAAAAPECPAGAGSLNPKPSPAAGTRCSTAGAATAAVTSGVPSLHAAAAPPPDCGAAARAPPVVPPLALPLAPPPAPAPPRPPLDLAAAVPRLAAGAAPGPAAATDPHQPVGRSAPGSSAGVGVESAPATEPQPAAAPPPAAHTHRVAQPSSVPPTEPPPVPGSPSPTELQTLVGASGSIQRLPSAHELSPTSLSASLQCGQPPQPAPPDAAAGSDWASAPPELRLQPQPQASRSSGTAQPPGASSSDATSQVRSSQLPQHPSARTLLRLDCWQATARIITPFMSSLCTLQSARRLLLTNRVVALRSHTDAHDFTVTRLPACSRATL